VQSHNEITDLCIDACTHRPQHNPALATSCTHNHG
jgi:hypothetical protein